MDTGNIDIEFAVMMWRTPSEKFEGQVEHLNLEQDRDSKNKKEESQVKEYL